MNNLADSFNQTLVSFINFLIALNTVNTSKIKLYKGVTQSMISREPSWLIEQFIIHILPFYEKIKKKDIDYFMNKTYDSAEEKVNGFFKEKYKEDNKNSNMLDALEMKKIFPLLTKNKQDLICEYLIFLADSGKDYLDLMMIQQN